MPRYINDNAQNKLLGIFLKNFNSMPKWIRSGVVIAIIFGVFYFSYIRKEVIYSDETNQITLIDQKVNVLNKKIVGIEKIRESSKELSNNLGDIQDLFEAVETLQRHQSDLTLSYLNEMAKTPEQITRFQSYKKMMDTESDIYKKKIDSIFEKKLKEKLSE